MVNGKLIIPLKCARPHIGKWNILRNKLTDC
ncbi:hypothetical protein MPLB_1510169 [Mesorhizobium sp. ORS 3324]|nr:hypothetical protein MPLB_1510169 [Mesorhizobium sp. ORS 3324]